MNIVILNGIAYILSFFLYQRKKGIVDVGTFIYALFAFSALGSVWYYSLEYVDQYYPNITFLPFLYLWILINVCLYPMYRSNFEKIHCIDSEGIGAILDFLSIYLITFSLLPLISLVLKFSISDMVGDTLGEMYEVGGDKAEYYFSGISKISFALIRRFGDLAIVLFFYQISKKRRNRWLVLGLLLSNAFFFLFSLVSGSRGGMLATLFVFIALGLFLKKCFDESIFLKLKKMAITITIIIGIMIAMISISRFNYSVAEKSSTATLDRWISQYIGEGYIRFNDDLWNVDKRMHGSQNFYYFKTLVGKGSVRDYPTEMRMYETKLGVPVTVFYTFIGDLYLDFGLLGTCFCTILFALSFSIILHSKSGRINISQLMLLSICMHMLSFGFAANLYRSAYIQRDTMILIILAIILYFIQKTNKYLINKRKLNVTHSSL